MSDIPLHAEHARLAAALRQSKRLRLTHAQLWDQFRLHCPALASRSDQRHALLETLTALAQVSVLRLPAESRWDRSLSPPLPLSVDVLTDEPLTALAQQAWLPQMAFAASVRNPATRAALAAINHYLRIGAHVMPAVPLRERSLHVFGDEKRLETFVVEGSLFNGQLSFADLGIYQPAVPLANEAQALALGAPLLIVENHHSYESFRNWNSYAAVYSAIVWGAGNSLPASISALPSLARASRSTTVLYLGDLDPEGLLILQRTQAVLPSSITPHFNLYRWLLRHGARAPLGASLRSHAEIQFAGWPQALVDELRALWAGGERIAQEGFGTRELAALNSAPP